MHLRNHSLLFLSVHFYVHTLVPFGFYQRTRYYMMRLLNFCTDDSTRSYSGPTTPTISHLLLSMQKMNVTVTFTSRTMGALNHSSSLQLYSNRDCHYHDCWSYPFHYYSINPSLTGSLWVPKKKQFLPIT